MQADSALNFEMLKEYLPLFRSDRCGEHPGLPEPRCRQHGLQAHG